MGPLLPTGLVDISSLWTSRVMRLVREGNPDARVILITGHSDELEETIRELVADGADAVCYKPFDVPQLIDTVRQLALPTQN